MIHVPISIRVASLALGQSNDCPRASETTLKDMSKFNLHMTTIVCAICAHFVGSTTLAPHHLPIYTKWPLQSYRHITVIVSAECTKYRGFLAMKGCHLRKTDTRTHSGLARGTKYWQKNFAKVFVLFYEIITSHVYFRVLQQGFIHIIWIINYYRQDYATFQMIWYISK